MFLTIAGSGGKIILEALGTLALIQARGVDTLGVPRARIIAQCALILVHTLMRVLIKLIPTVTLTLEAPHSVHAGPVLADSLHHGTLVYLLHVPCDWVHNLPRATSSTQVPVFLTVSVWTGLAIKTPSFAH